MSVFLGDRHLNELRAFDELQATVLQCEPAVLGSVAVLHLRELFQL